MRIRKKDDSRQRVRAAIKDVINVIRLPSDRIQGNLTDVSHIVKNHPSDVGLLIEQLRLKFDKSVWDLTCKDMIQKLPSIDTINKEHDYLCVYDFYKVMRDSKYFSHERAAKRIKEFGVRDIYQPYAHKNIRGVYTLQQTHSFRSLVDWHVAEFNFHWKQILALGARCSFADDRQMYWKTTPTSENPVQAIRIADDSFDIIIKGAQPEITMNQVQNFLNHVSCKVYSLVLRPYKLGFRIKVAKPSEKPETINGPITLTEMAPPNYYVPAATLETFKPKEVVVEEHFYKEMEKSVNEMSLIVDDYDRQIDELSGKADKIRAQRSKLLHAMKALRS